MVKGEDGETSREATRGRKEECQQPWMWYNIKRWWDQLMAYYNYARNIVSQSPNLIESYTIRSTVVLVLVLVINNSVVNPTLLSSTHSSKSLVFITNAMSSSLFSATSSITDSSFLLVLPLKKHVLHPICFSDSRCLAIMRLATSSRRLVSFS